MKTRMNSARTLALAAACVLGVSAAGHAAVLPVTTSANLSAHFDASNMNDDGGATNPGDGNGVDTWNELVGGTQLIDNFPTDGKPTYVAAGSGGINNQPTVRFVSDGNGTNTGVGDGQADDLLFDNPANFSARTIIAVTTMDQRPTGVLQTLVSDAFHGLNVRQTTTNTAAYFTGNSGDFLNGTAGSAGGSFNINGNPRYDIPGGFGEAHVLKLVRNSAANYNGVRISDNITPDRRWNGDVAEILFFDGVLDGNDMARVNAYITEKYAITQVVDEATTNTSQVADAPFGPDQPVRHLAVNFHYAGPTVDSTFKGIAFDNVDVTTLPTGPITLSANPGGNPATLTLIWDGFGTDNTQRTQSAGFTGTDAATLNAVANEMFYLSDPAILGADHYGVTMIFDGLRPLDETYIQVLGGDGGWNGDISVIANGLDVDWTTVANGSGATGSLLAFWAMTDAAGRLSVDFRISAGNFAGIGGIIVSQHIPAPAALPAGLALMGLTLARRRRARA